MASVLTSGSEVVVGGRLSAEDVGRAACGARLVADPLALDRVEANRSVLTELLSNGTSMYGINTGFGALVKHRVPVEVSEQLQGNLLRSHAAGTGPELTPEHVRAAIAVRVHGLLQAHSGIRAETLAVIIEMLNAGFTPVVPRIGSLGASGDLAPSAHAFLPLIGEGHLRDADGKVTTGREALARIGRPPVRLAAKEGLALINGTHFMAGIGALSTVSSRRILRTADLAAALTLEAVRGASSALDPRIHALRPLQGQGQSAARIAAAIVGSRRVDTSKHLQDPYSLRCAPQVHGAAHEAAAFHRSMVEIDINAVTDNPLVFSDTREVLSGGNFHGQSLALAADTLRLGLTDVASVSERRTFRMVSPSLNGQLPDFLTPSTGLASGYMVAQYTAAALLAQLRAIAHPASVDSVPTSDNQEDHVSMGMTAALLTADALPLVETVLAIEILCACQAIDLDPGRCGKVSATAHRIVREMVAPLEEDRPPAPDIEAVRRLIASGRILDAFSYAVDGEEHHH